MSTSSIVHGGQNDTKVQCYSPGCGCLEVQGVSQVERKNIIRSSCLLQALMYTWYTAVWQDEVRRRVFDFKSVRGNK